MLRAPELLRRPEEHDPALLHQPDRVAQQQPLTHVVRHEDDRLAETPLQREELALQLDARDRIERPERLIQQEERRIGGERPGDADPLALPARQLVGVARTEHAGIEADQGEELARPRGDALGGPPLEARHQTDVALDREVREQPDLLDDVADAAAQPGGLERVRGPSGDPDLARRGLEQAIDQLEGRGLARAAAPEQHQCFPGATPKDTSSTRTRPCGRAYRAPRTSRTALTRVRPAPSGIGDRRSCPATARRAPRPRESGAGSPERTCRSGSWRAARPHRGAALLRPSALRRGGRHGSAWR